MHMHTLGAAVSLSPVLGGSAAAAAMLAVNAAWPGSPIASLFLLLALVFLAGSAASVLDEDTAAVADATPRTLRWRTAARLPALSVPSAVWCGGVALQPLRSPGSTSFALLFTGLAILVVAVTTAAVVRRIGHETPSTLAAPLIGISVLGLGLFHPLSRWVSIVPADAVPPAQTRVSAAVTLVCLIASFVATRDPYRWRLLRDHAGRAAGRR
jgi:hypothetical protein